MQLLPIEQPGIDKVFYILRLNSSEVYQIMEKLLSQLQNPNTNGIDEFTLQDGNILGLSVLPDLIFIPAKDYGSNPHHTAFSLGTKTLEALKFLMLKATDDSSSVSELPKDLSNLPFKLSLFLQKFIKQKGQ